MKLIAIIFDRFEIFDDGKIIDKKNENNIPEIIYNIRDILINKKSKSSLPSILKILTEDICERYNNEEYWDFEILNDFIIENLLSLNKNDFEEYLKKLNSYEKDLLKDQLNDLKNFFVDSKKINEKLQYLKGAEK